MASDRPVKAFDPQGSATAQAHAQTLEVEGDAGGGISDTKRPRLLPVVGARKKSKQDVR